jgi:hypothetical protein
MSEGAELRPSVRIVADKSNQESTIFAAHQPSWQLVRTRDLDLLKEFKARIAALITTYPLLLAILHRSDGQYLVAQGGSKD